MRATRKDSGAMQVSFIAKLAIAMAIVGVAGYDSVVVLVTHVSTTTDANNAANSASEDWQSTHNVTSAYEAAVESVAGRGERVLRCPTCFSIDSDNTVHLELRRTAKTLLLSRIGFLKSYGVVTEQGEANYNPS